MAVLTDSNLSKFENPINFLQGVGVASGETVDLAGAVVKGIGSALTDPGTAAAIPVTRSASVAIVTAGSETNTLAIPAFVGQTLSLYADTYAVGNRVVTSAQRINQAGNTIMTFGAAGDFIKLEAITIAGALRWQVVANDGVALS
jgi:hypothetical protein